jgi:formate hydrogenlyase transcriptional activator
METPDLQLLIDSTPGLIHTSLPDGYLDFFNQTWLNYVGRSLEELQGWKWTECIHPDDLEGIVQKWRASLTSGEPFLHEARVRRADGEYRWMLHHKVALRNEHGNIIKWYGSSIDIEDRKRTEEQLCKSAQELQRRKFYLAEAQRLGHMGTWVFDPAGRFDYWSRELFHIHGLDPANGAPSAEEYLALVHPQDREFMRSVMKRMVVEASRFDVTKRILRPSGELRYVRCVGTPVVDNGTLKTVGLGIDVTEPEQLMEELRRSEFYLAEGQRLGHTGSWAFNADGYFEHWSQELFQIYGLDPQKGAPPLEQYLATVHPADRDFMAQTIRRMHEQGSSCDVKKRIIRPDGALRYIRCVGVPVLDNGVLKGFLGTAMDVTEQEQLTQELQRREAYLAEAQRLSHTGSFGWKPDSGEIVWSDETYRIFEYDRAIAPTMDLIVQRVHPEDRADFLEVVNEASGKGTDFEHTYRLLMPDGRVKHFHALAHATRDECGNREFLGAGTDITERENAKEKVREREEELRQVLDLTPQLVIVFGPAGERLYANRTLLDYLGISLQEWQQRPDSSEFIHPEDRDRVRADSDRALSSGVAYELELRLRKSNGQYRWFLTRYKPIFDEHGQITRWYVTAADIEDRKRIEERLQEENVALREEISKASMFEEIVGASPALQTVLSRISKVAPTASTVLITGETGTGKELIARAVHRRSQRCSHPFVSVNCAAIPRDLIASELFGHEKGAFTGALQRRLGKFELAEGGTIFLDEIGELPAETQIALLRVLQEHEFERVGGNQAIRTDARVIAATNCDLQAAIAAGTFRSDLFYRLNVFPIDVPPLRARKDDIPILVEYFIDRFARQAGKKIKSIDKKTLELIQAYPWPGNIRELQNVIERSVVLCETETFSVDESWLSQASSSPQAASPTLSRKPVLEEKGIIEAALAETRGRVSGQAGAAAKLGIPSTTLESKIKSLKINKHCFKAS